MADIDGFIAATWAGSGDLLVLVGEPGIGKTHLATLAARRARAQGMVVAWAACGGSEGVPGLWTWHQVLRQVAVGHPHLAQELPWLDGPPREAPQATGGRPGPGPADGDLADPELARSLLFDQVTQALVRAGRVVPVLVVIDDLHRCDPLSRRLLAYLAPQLPSMAVSVVATARPAPEAAGGGAGRIPTELVGLGQSRWLDGLGPEDLAALVGSALGTRLDSRAGRVLHRHTGGNPLFARELARHLLSRGELGGLTESPASPPPVPANLRAVLEARLAGLSAECRHALEVASCLGDEFALEVVCAVQALVPAEALEVLGEAEAAGLVTHRPPGRFAFVHSLMRAGAYDAMPVADRVRLHGRVAQALVELGARGQPVEEAVIAHHYLRSAAAGDAARAVVHATRAARQAMATLAYDEARSLYGQALEALDLDPAAGDRAELALALARAASAAGDQAEARRACRLAAEVGRGRGRGDVVARAALALAGGIDVGLFDDEQEALLAEALRLLDPDELVLRSRVTARLSVAVSLSAPVSRRLALCEEAVDLARRSGDPSVLGHALAAYCDARAGPADTEVRLEVATEVVGLGQATGDARLELLGRRLRLVALLELGEIGAADAEVAEFSRRADRLRHPDLWWYPPLWRGMRALMEGRMDDVELHHRQVAERGASAAGDNADILGMVLRFFMLLAQGRGREAEDLFLAKSLGFEMLDTWIRVTAALAAAHSGRLEAACSLLDSVTPAGLEALPFDSETLPVASQICDVALRLGGHPAVDWAHGVLSDHPDRWVVEGIGAVCNGSGHRYLGVTSALRGDLREAERHFDIAVEAHRRVGADLLVAATLADRGRALGDDAAREESTSLLEHLGVTVAVRPPASSRQAGFIRHGETWTISYAGLQVELKHVKGLGDLAVLLSRPGREIPASVLVAGSAGALPNAADLGEVIDDRARAAYRRRLVQLDEELERADVAGDSGRSARLQAERDALLGELAAATGLGGRHRRSGSDQERARTAATWRIRDAISRIESVHPRLGRHLRASVHTGRHCGYDPPEPVDWDL